MSQSIKAALSGNLTLIILTALSLGLADGSWQYGIVSVCVLATTASVYGDYRRAIRGPD